MEAIYLIMAMVGAIKLQRKIISGLGNGNHSYSCNANQAGCDVVWGEYQGHIWWHFCKWETALALQEISCSFCDGISTWQNMTYLLITYQPHNKIYLHTYLLAL